MFNRSNCSAADFWKVDMATDGTCLIPAGPLTLTTSVHLTEQEKKERKMMKRRREKVVRAELAEIERERQAEKLKMCQGKR